MITYASYVVERSDGNQYEFSDADLCRLCTYDLPTHFSHTDTHRKIKIYAIGHVNIRNVMCEYVRFWIKRDFETGLQLGVDKLSITKIDEYVPSLENWVVNSMVTSPQLGFVYGGEDRRKKFFRPAEIYQYSDDTLSRICNIIMSNRGSDFVQEEPADQIIRVIDEHRRYRAMIMWMYERMKNDPINPVDDFPR